MTTNTALQLDFEKTTPSTDDYDISFIDLCAGIGGGRLGLEKQGFKSKGFSEIDNKAISTYNHLFPEDENLGDVTKLKSVPYADILIAGFPCQTFSIVGKRQGFEDERGQIIFSIAKILRETKTPYFILENVKGLKNINKGNELKRITELLSNSGYRTYYQVLNSHDFGVPQMRERIYFVGIRKDLPNTYFNFPKMGEFKYNLSKFLTSKEDKYIVQNNPKKWETFQRYLNNKYNEGKYNLDDILQNNYLVLDTRQSDLRLYENKVPTLRKGRQGILYVKDGVLRALSGKEALLLQGFPLDELPKTEHITDTRLLAQAGNAMSVPVISAIAEELKKVVFSNVIEGAL